MEHRFATRKVVTIGIGVAAVFAVAVLASTRLFDGPLSPELVIVPNVANQQQDVARETLVEFGFKVTIMRERSTSMPSNQATRTDPPAGAKVAKDEPITLFISIGQP